jgi:hypothetical protein
MKAEIGKRYAQIVGGKCHWIFTSAELPEWQDDAFVTVDVTDKPQVVTGYIHDGGDAFSPPPPRDPAEIAEEARRAALRADAIALDMLSRLSTATPAQINAFVDGNVTDLAGARAMFKRIILILAIRG